MINDNLDEFERRWNAEVGEFLRFSGTCDNLVRKVDFEDAKAYRALLDKKPELSFHHPDIVFLNLIGKETELWDNDLYPPRLMFLSALMLIRWAVFKTTDDSEAAEYSEWASALQYMARWVEGK